MSAPSEAAGALRPHVTAANSLVAAGALSLSAGYLDGFSYLGHGHSFASAMTGNMVLLGINLTQSTPHALGNLYPLIAFVLGVATANVLARKTVSRYLPFTPYFTALLVEIAVLVTVSILPAGIDDHLIVAVVTISTAIQNTSFRNIGARTYNSVIMTGNLQAFSSSLAAGVWLGNGGAREQMRELGAVLLSFIAGAALGAVATPRFGNLATLAPAGVLAMLAVALVFASDEASVFERR